MWFFSDTVGYSDAGSGVNAVMLFILSTHHINYTFDKFRNFAEYFVCVLNSHIHMSHDDLIIIINNNNNNNNNNEQAPNKFICLHL